MRVERGISWGHDPSEKGGFYYEGSPWAARGAGCPVSPDDANDITITLTRGDWAKDGPYHGLDRGRLKLN